MSDQSLWGPHELDTLELPLRVRNALRRGGIETLGMAYALADEDDATLLLFPHLGTTGVAQFRAAIAARPADVAVRDTVDATLARCG